MPEDNPNLARLFNTLDHGDWIELAVIVFVAITLIRSAPSRAPAPGSQTACTAARAITCSPRFRCCAWC